MQRFSAVIAFLGLLILSHTSSADRLVEEGIKFSVHGAVEDVPILDPPKRVAGYFKLDRTQDAHMFYFFYESRSKRADDPVVLWMTGSCAKVLRLGFFCARPFM